MCEELELSRDAYYKWLKRKNRKNRYEINHEILKPFIKNIMIYRTDSWI